MLNDGGSFFVKQGETAFARGEYSRAAAFYEEAARDREDPKILGALARAWLTLGRSEDAKKVLVRLVDAHPDHLSAIQLLSGLYEQEGAPEKALPLFERFRSQGGQLDSSAKLQLARIYRQARRYEEAAPIYIGLMKESRQRTKAHRELAEMRSWQGRYEESIDLFHKLLAADPNNREARLGLARTLSWAGRFGESAAEYKKLLKEP